MADFTDRASLGTSRINPSSMIPGSRSNAPQIGAVSQFRRPAAPAANMADTGGAPQQMMARRNALAYQLNGTPPASAPRVQMPPQPQRQSDLPTQTQQMLPNGSDKKKTRSFKQDDFKMLSDVFKTLSEQ